MKLTDARVVDRLVVEGQCLGAVFTTFTFDPRFFEETILRAVLRLTSDPVEQRARFLDEARAAIVEQTPVACIVDASMRLPGQRMPYDLLEVTGRTFHPKVALLLFESFARLHVGSGNLTRGGYGENSELFVTVDLIYTDSGAVAVLRQIDDFLASTAAIARVRGTQLDLVRAELGRWIAAPPGDAAPFGVLHTERDSPILDQLLALVPEDGRITRVGVLAPFFERDDASTGAELRSVLGRLAATRKSTAFVFDVGVAWDDAAAVSSPDGLPPEFEGAVGSLWARRAPAEGDEERIEYFSLDGLTANQLHVRDASGTSRRLARDELEGVRRGGKAWAVPRRVQILVYTVITSTCEEARVRRPS